MLLSNKASAFVYLWLPFLFACEMYRPENVRIPPTVGTLNAEFEALPNPNSYQAKISWTHLEPPDGVLERSEAGSVFKPVGVISAADGEWKDGEVQAGREYEYRIASLPTLVKKVKIPVDYVANWNLAYLRGPAKGPIVGYHRLFLGALSAETDVEIDVDEIVVLESVSMGQIFASGFRPHEEARGDGRPSARPGNKVRIRAKRLRGSSLGIATYGQSGGAGVEGQSSGAIDIELDEPTQTLIGMQVGRGIRRGGKNEIGPVQVRAAGKTLLQFDEQHFPSALVGLYQTYPTSVVTPDGFIYTLNLIREEGEAKFERISKQDAFEMLLVTTGPRMLLKSTDRRREPLPREGVSSEWRVFADTISECAKLKTFIDGKATFETKIPDSFSASPESLETLQKVNADPGKFLEILESKKLSHVIFSFEKGASFIEGETLVLRSEVPSL